MSSPLTPGPTPKLRSIPALYPLPASLALSSTSSHIATAAALLALPPPGAYPPAPADPLLKPYVDVDRGTGQVYVAVDGSPPTATQSRRRMSFGRARSEWLVVIEFEADIDEDTTNGETWYKVGPSFAPLLMADLDSYAQMPRQLHPLRDRPAGPSMPLC